jgi:hypothetical protein
VGAECADGVTDGGEQFDGNGRHDKIPYIWKIVISERYGRW